MDTQCAYCIAGYAELSSLHVGCDVVPGIGLIGTRESSGARRATVPGAKPRARA